MALISAIVRGPGVQPSRSPNSLSSDLLRAVTVATFAVPAEETFAVFPLNRWVDSNTLNNLFSLRNYKCRAASTRLACVKYFGGVDRKSVVKGKGGVGGV